MSYTIVKFVLMTPYAHAGKGYNYYIIGPFNGWSTITPLTYNKSDGGYSGSLGLASDEEHRYRFVTASTYAGPVVLDEEFEQSAATGTSLKTKFQDNETNRVLQVGTTPLNVYAEWNKPNSSLTRFETSERKASRVNWNRLLVIDEIFNDPGNYKHPPKYN